MPIKTSTVVCLLCFLLSACIPAPLAAQTPSIAAPQANSVRAEVQSIEAACGTKPGASNPRKYEKELRKYDKCLAKMVRDRQQNLRLQRLIVMTAQSEAQSQQQLEQMLATPPAATPSSPPIPTNLAPQTLSHSLGTAPSAATQVPTPADTGTAQNFYGASLSNTPSTCGAGNGINAPSLIRVHRTILTPDTVSDDFGYRLGHRFIVYQVRVENGSKDNQFMLQDVTVDFTPQLAPQSPAGTYSYSASGQDLTLLRGIPEKGQDLDPRNLTYHILQGIGSVAGAVSGLTPLASVMGPAVAVFNGSFLQGYTTLAPDHTATQLNRLSDSAFTANTVIDKQRATTVALFIPMDELLSRAEQSDFRSDPNAFIGFDAVATALNKADICVDGTFIQAAVTAAPTLSTATFPTGSTPTANTTADVTVAGTNLVGGDTMLILSGNVPTTAPVIVAAGGKSGTAQIQLPADFDITTTTATLQSKSNPTLNSGTGIKLQIAN